MDAAGSRPPVELGSTCIVRQHSTTAREFDAIVRAEGLKAALAWTADRRYEERLAADRPRD